MGDETKTPQWVVLALVGLLSGGSVGGITALTADSLTDEQVDAIAAKVDARRIAREREALQRIQADADALGLIVVDPKAADSSGPAEPAEEE